MKILIVSGAFKDVFNPIEACNMIEGALNVKNKILKAPICDGGEYTYEVLREYLQYKEVIANQVLNAYGKKVDVRYLVDGNEAHVISSEVIRLYPKEDALKNPLKLSDFGLGQVVLDAINKGYKKIKLYLGGTSTVCCGMGFAQALGAKLYNYKNQEMKSPILGEELVHVTRIEKPYCLYSDVLVEVIADGDAKSFEMSGITRLKIGKSLDNKREMIIEKSSSGIASIVRASNIPIDTPFSGAAGGLVFGIEQIFHPQYRLGGDYFLELLGVKEKIEWADIVITGEGRFDNSACGKTPVAVASLAKKINKPLYFVCGKVDKKIFHDYKNGILSMDQEPMLLHLGINKLFTCQEYYDMNSISESYMESIEMYKEKTPKLLKKLFERDGI